jgi:flavin reductase (DIM6/NTAB) family NADH-FMN oxidoreductase RutF
MSASPWLDARYPAVVALVSTVDGEGRVNASPKVWWSPTSYSPPMLMLSVKPDTDTRLNIDETGMFVLHLPGGSDIEEVRQVLHTAKRLPHGDNELDDVGLKWQWLEHDALERPMPYCPQFPWFCCWVTWRTSHGDHELYLAQVGLSGGYEPAELHEDTVEGDDRAIRSFSWYSGGIGEVLLHRGRNVFVAPESDSQFSVPPYR